MLIIGPGLVASLAALIVWSVQAFRSSTPVPALGMGFFFLVALFLVAGKRSRRSTLLGAGLALAGLGYAGGGYQFEVHGDPQGEPIVLLGRLFGKIRRGLSLKYLEEDDLGLHIAEDKDLVCGRITSDEGYDARMPLLVIDGREVTWEAFGRMLMTFEGWRFKVEIRDRGEEI